MTSLLDLIAASEPKPHRDCAVSMSGAHVVYTKDGVTRCVLCSVEVAAPTQAPCS